MSGAPSPLDWRRDAAALSLALLAALFPLRILVLQSDWRTQDAHSSAIRLAALDFAMRDGERLGRWCATLDRGFGYPLFTYYGPGFYGVAALFYRIGLGLTASWKLALAAFQLLGCAGMFWLGRIFYGRAAAALAALAWAFLPYQQCNLYVRGAFAEFAALHLLAVALACGAWGARRRAPALTALGAAAHAALIATHAITALIATSMAGAFLAAFEWRKRRRLDHALLFVALALGLSAFYWIAALFGREWIRASAMLADEFDYRYHFLQWPQWLNVFYWGYGVSVPGPGDEMPFHLGAAQLAFFCLAWSWVWRGKAGASFPLVAGSALAGAAFFCTLGISRPLWDAFPLAAYIQFPWRLLGEAGLFMALAAGAALEAPLRAGRLNERRRAWLAAGAMAAVALAPPWHFQGPDSEPPPISERPSREEMLSRDWQITGEDEFLPRAVERKWPSAYPPRQAVSLAGEGRAEAVEDSRGGWIIRIDAPAPGLAAMGLYWFPGWELRRDEEFAECRPMRRWGLIEFDAPAGESVFRLSRGKISLHRLGDRATQLSAALALLLALRLGKNRPSPRRRSTSPLP